MNCVKIDLPRDFKQLKIEIFSDLHIGDKHCNFNLIHERIRRVKEEENTYGIMLGDTIDNPTKSSVGDTYEETLSPMQQIKTAISLFEPIKDKILGGVGGNHEFRTYKTEGIDLMYFLFSEFHIAERYNQDGTLLFLRLGEEERGRKITGKDEIRQILYTLYMTHGSANGRTPGAKVNGLMRLGSIINPDIIVAGHTHFPTGTRDSVFEIDSKNNQVIERETLYVNGSSTLEWGGYSERMGMKPSSLTSPVILLNGTKKEYNAII